MGEDPGEEDGIAGQDPLDFPSTIELFGSLYYRANINLSMNFLPGLETDLRCCLNDIFPIFFINSVSLFAWIQ